MTSALDLKTNEFLRRRKLRLQQVREQSKEIAKKIRQRAQVEKQRQIKESDAIKQKEYFECQDKLVRKLEDLYTQSLKNVGTSHKNASEHKVPPKHLDLSKSRANEAAAALRKKKQEVLDKKKSLLDRKLYAREIANEISRGKSLTTSQALDKPIKPPEDNKDTNTNTEDPKIINEGTTQNNVIAKADMATQWESNLPNEWETDITERAHPKDDDVPRDADKNKKIDLFAISDEMPSSLRGSYSNLTTVTEPIQKTCLSLVSEFLKNRDLRLREPVIAAGSSKQNFDDLQSLKQTILRTRATNSEVSANLKTVKTSSAGPSLLKKNSVTVYNHVTRDTREIPLEDHQFVAPDVYASEDAYSQAMRESTEDKNKTEDIKKTQARHKIAINKTNVDKEYQNTIKFLKSLPKTKTNSPVKNAYLDEHQQQKKHDSRQRKLQNAYKNIERECLKQNQKSKENISDTGGNISKSPARKSKILAQDFEYSWMPVPESDNDLAVHTIPTSVNKTKAGNSVKFGQVDSYHEYRSRHKHTPPTKDTANKGNLKEKDDSHESDNETDGSSVTSDSSVIEASKKTKENIQNISDAERIIIYKILDSKCKRKRCKKRSKFIENIDQMLLQKHSKTDELTRLKKSGGDTGHNLSLEHLNEGIYRSVSRNGKTVESASKYFEEKTQEECDDTYGKENKSKCQCNLTTHKVETSSSARSSDGCKNCQLHSPKTSKLVQNSKSSPQQQPSPSTSSFQTANTEKINTNMSNKSFVNLLNDNMGNSNDRKFYIGASGFIKDDNYEVIIQLRKKDEQKIESKKDEITTTDELSKITSNLPTNEVNIQCDHIEKRDQSLITEKISDNKEQQNSTHSNESDAPKAYHRNIEKIQETENKASSSTTDYVSTKTEDKEVSDKAVGTTPQQSQVFPNNEPIFDHLSRPTTSICTQTSFHSPRPGYYHMSSSTSTAYLSPPDIIFPKYSHPDYFIKHRIEKRSKEIDKSCLDAYLKCKCNRCVRWKKTECHSHSECEYNERNFKVPPNTAKSSRTDFVQEESDSSSIVHKTRTKCKCKKHSRKCSHQKHRKKSCNNDDDEVLNKKKTLLNFKVKQPLLRNKNKFDMENRAYVDKNVDPVIESYIKKLLTLNSEALKAFEVADQEVSSVTTPGSSVINLPCNTDKNKLTQENLIPLDIVKKLLKQHILTLEKKPRKKVTYVTTKNISKGNISGTGKNKSANKIKSLNISNKISSKQKTVVSKQCNSTSTTTKEDTSGDPASLVSVPCKNRSRSKSSPTPRGQKCLDLEKPVSDSNIMNHNRSIQTAPIHKRNNSCQFKTAINLETKTLPHKDHSVTDQSTVMINSQALKNICMNQGKRNTLFHKKTENETLTMAFKTSQHRHDRAFASNADVDSDLKEIKTAKNKLKNMDKIADLTTKCTQRLSNLAKVLEEVRKSKTMTYSQISSSASTSSFDKISNKDENFDFANKSTTISVNSSTAKSETFNNFEYSESMPVFTSITQTDQPQQPLRFSPEAQLRTTINAEPSAETPYDNSENVILKNRSKPPPALSRIHLKQASENMIPHELSTVLEVDSPMSLRVKSQSSNTSKNIDDETCNDKIPANKDNYQNSQSKSKKPGNNDSSSSSKEETKTSMIDMKQFNEIQLKPFISVHEYAKQNSGEYDEFSNFEDGPKSYIELHKNDEVSSLHSDNSLPDVIAELIKRNVINEPFKFDSTNGNSTTVSSDNTVPGIGLSKTRKEKSKYSIMLQDKENANETSDTLSISSNPDLEKVFKNLRIGWASSTLKKTKEMLALSSSSNTSSSSLSNFRTKIRKDVPVLVSDSMSSLSNFTSKQHEKSGIRQNTGQHSSVSKNMTVKEFLTQELAKKITFNKSTRNESEEFVSLYETKMPEKMKHSSQMIREERSIDESTRSGINNRPRTSTPLQLYKSMMYHSTSSSNVSNGLFSNVEELSSVKGTSNSMRNNSTSEKDDLTIPNYSLKKKNSSDSKSN